MLNIGPPSITPGIRLAFRRLYSVQSMYKVQKTSCRYHSPSITSCLQMETFGGKRKEKKKENENYTLSCIFVEPPWPPSALPYKLLFLLSSPLLQQRCGFFDWIRGPFTPKAFRLNKQNSSSRLNLQLGECRPPIMDSLSSMICITTPTPVHLSQTPQKQSEKN